MAQNNQTFLKSLAVFVYFSCLIKLTPAEPPGTKEPLLSPVDFFKEKYGAIFDKNNAEMPFNMEVIRTLMESGRAEEVLGMLVHEGKETYDMAMSQGGGSTPPAMCTDITNAMQPHLYCLMKFSKECMALAPVPGILQMEESSRCPDELQRLFSIVDPKLCEGVSQHITSLIESENNQQHRQAVTDVKKAKAWLRCSKIPLDKLLKLATEEEAGELVEIADFWNSLPQREKDMFAEKIIGTEELTKDIIKNLPPASRTRLPPKDVKSALQSATKEEAKEMTDSVVDALFEEKKQMEEDESEKTTTTKGRRPTREDPSVKETKRLLASETEISSYENEPEELVKLVCVMGGQLKPEQIDQAAEMICTSKNISCLTGRNLDRFMSKCVDIIGEESLTGEMQAKAPGRVVKEKLQGKNLSEAMGDLSNLKEHQSELTENVKRALRDSAEDMLDADMVLTEDVLEECSIIFSAGYPGVVQRFKDIIIPKLTGLEDKFCEMVSEMTFDLLPPAQSKLLGAYHDFCIENTDWTTELLGKAAGGASSEQTAEELLEAIGPIAENMCDMDELIEIWRKVEDHIDGDYTEEVAEKIKEAIPMLPAEETQTARSQSTVMCKGMDMAEATQDKLLECEDGRQCKACGEAQKYSENSLIDNAITSLDESCDTESSRRKRSVSSGSVTCDLLTQLDDSSVCSLNSSQVDTIDIDMLTDCPTSLGQVNGCDETWCELLYNRAVALLGEPDGWNSSTVEDLGVISLCTGDASMFSTFLNDSSIVASLGGYDVDLPLDKFQAFYSEWKTVNEISADQVTDADMSTLGSLLCGAETEDIHMFDKNYYSSVSYDVGQLTCFGQDEIKAWALLAEDAFNLTGNASHISTADITNIGVIMGGMNDTLLTDLDGDQWNYIDEEAIPYLSVSATTMFTADQLDLWSTAQLAMLSYEQRADMTSDAQMTVCDKLDDDNPLCAAGVTTESIIASTDTNTDDSNNEVVTGTDSMYYTTDDDIELTSENSTGSDVDSSETTDETITDSGEDEDSDNTVTYGTVTDDADSDEDNDNTVTDDDSGSHENTQNPVDPGDPEETEEPVDPDPVTGGTTRPTWTLPKAPSSMTDSDIQQPSVYSKLSDPKVSPKDLAGLGDLSQASVERLQQNGEGQSEVQKFLIADNANTHIQAMTTNNFDVSYAASSIEYLTEKTINQWTNEQVISVAANLGGNIPSSKAGALYRKLEAALVETAGGSAADKQAALRQTSAVALIKETTLANLINGHDLTSSQVLNDLKSVDLPSQQARKLIDDILTQNDGFDFTTATTSEVQSFLASINPDALREIRSGQISSTSVDNAVTSLDSLDDVRSSGDGGFDDYSPKHAAAAMLMDKIRSDGLGNQAVVDIQEMFDGCHLTLKDIQGLESTKACALYIDQVAKCNNAIALHLKSSCAGKVLPPVTQYLTPAQINTNLDPNNANLHALIDEHVCAGFRELDFTAERFFKVVSIVKARLDKSDVTDLKDRTKLSNYACILPYLGKTYLLKTNVGDRQFLCEDKLARRPFLLLSKQKASELVEFCTEVSLGIVFRSLCRTEHGLGMMVGMTQTLVNSIGCEAISSAADYLGQSVTDCAARQAIYQCIKQQTGFQLNNRKSQIQLAYINDQLTDADWNTISQVNLCGLLPFALDINEVNKELVKHRERMGYSPDTCTVFTPGHRRALISLYGADLSTACTGSQSSRRRRAVSDVTCWNLMMLRGSACDVLDATELASMSAAEFNNCPSLIGMLPGCSAQHWTNLAVVAKEAWGAVSTWTTNQVMTAGGIVSGLAVSDLSTLPLSGGVDVLTAVGYQGVWSADKLRQVYDRFKTVVLSNSAASMRGWHLQAMGHVACGAYSEDIAQFPSDQYCIALYEIGGSMHCDAGQKMAYAEHAKTCFGNVNTWTYGEIESVGHMLGGVTQADLGSIPVANIPAIHGNVIAGIPEMQVTGFTDDQLRAMDIYQAGSFTNEQYNSMSETSRKIIYDKIEPMIDEFGDPRESGCEFLEASVMLVVTTALALCLKI